MIYQPADLEEEATVAPWHSGSAVLLGDPSSREGCGSWNAEEGKLLRRPVLFCSLCDDTAVSISAIELVPSIELTIHAATSGMPLLLLVRITADGPKREESCWARGWWKDSEGLRSPLKPASAPRVAPTWCRSRHC